MSEIMNMATWIAKVGVGISMAVLSLKSISFIPVLGDFATGAGNLADQIFGIPVLGPALAIGAGVGTFAMAWYIGFGVDILGLGRAVTAPGTGGKAIEGAVQRVKGLVPQ